MGIRNFLRDLFTLPPKELFNRKVFFTIVRQSLFGGKLTEAQVTTLSGFLDYWEENYAKEDIRWLAYIMATTHHEVNKTFLPIKEYGGDSYFHRMYDIEGARPHVAKSLGNLAKGDGVKFHGRGFVQLTGRANYANWEKRLGMDLTSSRRAADKVLSVPVATEILFKGSIEGTFTGKKLGDYLSGPKHDLINARRVINHVDRASTIALYARAYLEALRKSVK